MISIGLFHLLQSSIKLIIYQRYLEMRSQEPAQYKCNFRVYFKVNINCQVPQQGFKNNGKIKVKSQIQIHHLMNIQIDEKQKKKNFHSDEYIAKIIQQSSQQAARRDSNKHFDAPKNKHQRQSSQQVANQSKQSFNVLDLKNLLQTSPYGSYGSPQQRNESFSSTYLNSNSPKTTQATNQVKFISSQLKELNNFQNSKVKPRISSAQKLSSANQTTNMLDPSIKMSQNVSSDQMQSYSIQNTPLQNDHIKRLLIQSKSQENLKNQQSNSEAIIRAKQECSITSARYERPLQAELVKIILHTSRILNSYKAQIVEAKKKNLQMQSYMMELESQLSYIKALLEHQANL